MNLPTYKFFADADVRGMYAATAHPGYHAATSMLLDAGFFSKPCHAGAPSYSDPTRNVAWFHGRRTDAYVIELREGGAALFILQK